MASSLTNVGWSEGALRNTDPQAPPWDFLLKVSLSVGFLRDLSPVHEKKMKAGVCVLPLSHKVQGLPLLVGRMDVILKDLVVRMLPPGEKSRKPISKCHPPLKALEECYPS